MDLIRRWVDEGATSPHAVIKRLESHERRFRLCIDVDGTAAWHPQDTEGNGPMLPNGRPAYRPMTMRGHMLTVPYYTGALNHNYIIDMLATESFDCVVELGCGYGRNLFEIFLGPATREQKEYAQARQWNVNFKDALVHARSRSAIGDPFVAPEIMGGDDLFNPTSLAIWRSAAR